MPTTSNFGWTTPADTDLVKNGALAIRTLGNGIDTSLAELKGGTTGQVLSKTSNTDMDFTWVTTDDANAIQNAIVDAKGDLIAATANDTPARLAVGNNGETLVADSSTSTGLRWNPSIAAGKNFLINGSFDIWQRGTSFTVASIAYTADRWQIWSTGAGGNCLVSRTSGTNGAQYALQFGRTSGSTSLTVPVLATTLETSDSLPLQGKTVILSFEALRGANYSGGSLSATIRTGTGTDQNFTAFTGATDQATTFTLSASNARYTTAPVTIPSNATQIAVYFSYTATGTAGAADFVQIQKVQLELGSVATEFRRAGGTLAGELQAAQRYYWQDSGFQQASGNQSSFNNTVYFPINTFNAVPMRVTPTAAFTSSPYIQDWNANLRTITGVSTGKNWIGFAYDSTKLASYYVLGVNFADAGRSLSLSAEL